MTETAIEMIDLAELATADVEIDLGARSFGTQSRSVTLREDSPGVIVDIIRRETFESSLYMARQVLKGLGLSKSESERLVDTFKLHDVERLHAHRHLHHDEERMAQLAMEWMQELETLFEQDAATELDKGPLG